MKLNQKRARMALNFKQIQKNSLWEGTLKKRMIML